MNSFSHFCPDLAVTVHEPFFSWGNSSTAGACFVVFWSQFFFFGSTAGDALTSPYAQGQKKSFFWVDFSAKKRFSVGFEREGKIGSKKIKEKSPIFLKNTDFSWKKNF